jgi:hypothetical protein
VGNKLTLKVKIMTEITTATVDVRILELIFTTPVK